MCSTKYHKKHYTLYISHYMYVAHFYLQIIQKHVKIRGLIMINYHSFLNSLDIV